MIVPFVQKVAVINRGAVCGKALPLSAFRTNSDIELIYSQWLLRPDRQIPHERYDHPYERSRWTMRFLYHTALRVSEAAHAKAGDFAQRRGRWWLHVVGKGGVEGDVPVSHVLMTEFARYRVFHGLPAAPRMDETTPAVMSIAGDAARL